MLAHLLFALTFVPPSSQVTPRVADDTYEQPLGYSLRSNTTCKRGKFSAEVASGPGGITLMEISGDGRKSTRVDAEKIDSALRKLNGLDAVSIDCQPDGSAFVVVRGAHLEGRSIENWMLHIKWSKAGAEILPSS